MKITDLIKKIKTTKELIRNSELIIEGISDDSRKVKQNHLFVAIKGFETDGHNYLKQAVENGAKFIIAEDESRIPSGVDYCVVENTRNIVGILANEFYDNPSHKVKVIGVTGTNGKTTTTYLLESIINESNSSAGVIGTIEYRYGSAKKKALNTTPSAIELVTMLSEMAKAKVGYAIIEVSSHSIDQKRIAGIQFVEGIFTNLTQDHLDYHKTIDEYGKVKKSFFIEHLWKQKKLEWGEDGLAILNADDPLTQKIIQDGDGSYVTYSVLKEADFYLVKSCCGYNKNELLIRHDGKEYTITSKLIGNFNLYNVLTSFSACVSLGLPVDKVIQGIEKLEIVPGRFERVDEGQDFLVIVDYSHTPDSLTCAIASGRDAIRCVSTKGRVITIFGCGGDRDKLKRPIMGKIAGESSDYCIITNDNPRTEDPEDIIKAILVGIKESGLSEANYEVITDREEAIRRGIEIAKSGDVLLIAGKGHENYQIIGKKKFDFDDKEIARKYLKKLISNRI